MVPDGSSRGNEVGGRLARRALLALLVVYPLAQLVVTALVLIFHGKAGLEEGLETETFSPLWMLLYFGTNQLVLLVSTLVCDRMRPRLPGGLGLRPSALSLPLTSLLVLGTPAVYVIGAQLGRLSGIEPGSSLQGIERAMFESRGAAANLFFVLATIAPACCEELFFRGFVQRALATSLRPWLAVCISGAVFALFHHDPRHVIMVLPVGLWFAFLAYRTQSTWVAMAAHLVGNANTMVLARLLGESALDGEIESIEPVVACVALAVVALSTVAFVWGLLLLRRQARSGSA